MRTPWLGFLRLGLVCSAGLSLTPLPGQTIEEICRVPDSRVADARVRVAWTAVQTDQHDVRVSYCVLRGDADAHLAFERNAEIVYFGLSARERIADRRSYTFIVRTSTGRVIKQGPAVLKPLARQPQSCRVDMCQFFTNPGERVVSVSVATDQPARQRQE